MEGDPHAVRNAERGMWNEERLVLVGALFCAALLAPEAFAEQKSEPNFLHGVGQVVGGVLFELPKTVIDATMTSPPIIGTVVGLFAGTARALQTTAAGLVEMSQGFNPWGAKKSP